MIQILPPPFDNCAHAANDFRQVLMPVALQLVVSVLRKQIHELPALGIRRTFQNLELFKDATVRENLVLGAAFRYRASVLADLWCRRSSGTRATTAGRSSSAMPRGRAAGSRCCRAGNAGFMRIHHAHEVFYNCIVTDRSAAPRRKRATNLSVDDRLLDRAKRLKLNLSQVFEAGLERAIRQREAEEWLKRNRAALDAYNERVEKQGVFIEGLRSF